MNKKSQPNPMDGANASDPFVMPRHLLTSGNIKGALASYESVLAGLGAGDAPLTPEQKVELAEAYITGGRPADALAAVDGLGDSLDVIAARGGAHLLEYFGNRQNRHAIGKAVTTLSRAQRYCSKGEPCTVSGGVLRAKVRYLTAIHLSSGRVPALAQRIANSLLRDADVSEAPIGSAGVFYAPASSEHVVVASTGNAAEPAVVLKKTPYAVHDVNVSRGLGNIGVVAKTRLPGTTYVLPRMRYLSSSILSVDLWPSRSMGGDLRALAIDAPKFHDRFMTFSTQMAYITSDLERRTGAMRLPDGSKRVFPREICGDVPTSYSGASCGLHTRQMLKALYHLTAAGFDICEKPEVVEKLSMEYDDIVNDVLFQGPKWTFTPFLDPNRNNFVRLSDPENVVGVLDMFRLPERRNGAINTATITRQDASLDAGEVTYLEAVSTALRFINAFEKSTDKKKKKMATTLDNHTPRSFDAYTTSEDRFLQLLEGCLEKSDYSPALWRMHRSLAAIDRHMVYAGYQAKRRSMLEEFIKNAKFTEREMELAVGMTLSNSTDLGAEETRRATSYRTACSVRTDATNLIGYHLGRFKAGVGWLDTEKSSSFFTLFSEIGLFDVELRVRARRVN